MHFVSHPRNPAERQRRRPAEPEEAYLRATRPCLGLDEGQEGVPLHHQYRRGVRHREGYPLVLLVWAYAYQTFFGVALAYLLYRLAQSLPWEKQWKFFSLLPQRFL